VELCNGLEVSENSDILNGFPILSASCIYVNNTDSQLDATITVY